MPPSPPTTLGDPRRCHYSFDMAIEMVSRDPFRESLAFMTGLLFISKIPAVIVAGAVVVPTLDHFAHNWNDGVATDYMNSLHIYAAATLLTLSLPPSLRSYLITYFVESFIRFTWEGTSGGEVCEDR